MYLAILLPTVVHMGSYRMSACPDYAVQSLCPSRPIVPWYTWDVYMSHGGLSHLTGTLGSHGHVCMSRLCRAVPLSIPSHGTHGIPRDVYMSRACCAVPLSIPSHSPMVHMGSHGMSACPNYAVLVSSGITMFLAPLVHMVFYMQLYLS